MRPFIFDTETTGLVTNSLVALRSQPRAIEFFGHAPESSEELEFFCDPGVPLSDEVSAITGIKREDLAGAHPFGYYAERVVAMIEAADAVVAHNLSYDMAIVDFELRRLDLSVNWPRRKICTVEATEHLVGHRLKLNDLHQLLFGEPFSGAHRARTDVMALTRCFNELAVRGEL